MKRTRGDGYQDNVVIRGAHDVSTGKRAKKAFYTQQWDLSDMPEYQPRQEVSGTLLVDGGYLMMGTVADAWRAGFAKYHPNLKIEEAKGVRDRVSSLVAREIDIQTGRPWTFYELSDYESRVKQSPMAIDWATGSFNVPGWSPAFAIFVHKDNPLTRVTFNQLDGILGGARYGGWVGTVWHPEVARGPEKNIRVWGQLGLTGEWTDKPIAIYGRPIRGYNIQINIERKVFQGGDLWNDNLLEYVHEVNPDGTRYVSSVEMVKDLAKDKYGISFSDLGSYIEEVKPLAIAAQDGGPYAELSLENLRSRTYPLFLEQWAYAKKPLEPKVKEFLRYVLSREGQEAIQRDGKWIPLPAAVVREQLKKLDEPEAHVNVAAMGLHEPLINVGLGFGDGVDETGKVHLPREKTFYTQQWDLGDLPAYKPEQKVAGTLRLPADGYLQTSTIAEAWMKGFGSYHPNVRFETVRGQLADQQIDLQPGRRWLSGLYDDFAVFHNQRKHSPLEIEMATGSYDVPGWSPALGILVHKDNPLTKLTMNQLDGIFGGARRGGWVGTAWRREVARGAGKNIRTWGQLGLTGEWTGQPIHVYARALPYHIMRVFENKVFQGGNMWNDNLREFADEIKPDGSRSISVVKMITEMSRDRYGITFCDLGSTESKDLKSLALARQDGGPYADLTLENVRNRSYPMFLGVFAYADREPGKPLEPKVKEFLRYILSREGQAAIQRDGKWLPLTGDVARRQLKKLD
ncbi:MAG: substrate-binding domain-containing protein [Opitutaceae bacterium]|nr:substrate-binding domain-containing protein [Opitutaceae bacterium]